MKLDHTFWITYPSEKAERGSGSLGVIANLAEAIRQEAFTQSHRANSLQFLLEIRVLPSYNLEPAYKLELYVSSGELCCSNC